MEKVFVNGGDINKIFVAYGDMLITFFFIPEEVDRLVIFTHMVL
jgi:hypothetical protein